MKIRIKQARERAELTQEQLSKKIGVSRGAVGLWESLKAKELPTLDNLSKIAAACGVSIGWLTAGDVGGFTKIHSQSRGVPLLLLEHVGNGDIPLSLFKDAKEDDLLPCPVKHSPKTYALKVQGASMTSTNPLARSYPDGCFIYCDPVVPDKVRSGSPVIAYLIEAEEAVFKIYMKDGGKSWLESINDRFENITSEFEIRACVIGSFHLP